MIGVNTERRVSTIPTVKIVSQQSKNIAPNIQTVLAPI